jgi:hypothetical protein
VLRQGIIKARVPVNKMGISREVKVDLQRKGAKAIVLIDRGKETCGKR